MPRANHRGHNIDWQSADNGERQLWAAVLVRALTDAAGISVERWQDKRDALEWLVGAGKDFRAVCSLAGFEPDFILGAWKNGRLNYERLREVNAEENRKRKKAAL